MFQHVDDLTHREKVLLWVFGRLQTLVQLELVKKGSVCISTKGIALYDQLNVDFVPSKWEVVQCLIEAKIINEIDNIIPITKLLYVNREDLELYIENLDE